MKKLINAIKSIKIKRTRPEPFTTGFLDDSTEKFEDGYNAGFADAQRMFRAAVLKQLNAIYPDGTYVCDDIFDGLTTSVGSRFVYQINRSRKGERIIFMDGEIKPHKIHQYRDVFDTIIRELPETPDAILAYLNERHLNPINQDDHRVVFDAVNGKWSGFPTCCNREYTLRNNTNMEMKFRNRHADIETKKFIESYEYCPCDVCINMRHQVSPIPGCFQYSNLTRTWHFLDGTQSNTEVQKWYDKHVNEKST